MNPSLKTARTADAHPPVTRAPIAGSLSAAFGRTNGLNSFTMRRRRSGLSARASEAIRPVNDGLELVV
jgi:hypothetical protein